MMDSTTIDTIPDRWLTLVLKINPDQTHDGYFDELDKWLEKEQAKGGE